MNGGEVAGNEEASACTHVLLLGPEDLDEQNQRRPEPKETLRSLLKSLRATGTSSKTIAEMHTALLCGKLHVVNPKWVPQCRQSSKTPEG